MIWRSVLDFVLYSSLFIAACAFALVWQTFLLLGEQVPCELAGMLFFGTVCLYNLESVFGTAAQPQTGVSEKRAWLMRHTLLMQGLALGAGVAAVALYLRGPALSWAFLLHLLLLSVLYTFPAGRRRSSYLPLRNIPLLKVFLVAYVWAALTVLLPLLYLGRDLGEPVHLVLFIRRFLFIFALALLFDVRDYSRDKLLGTITFPVLLGSRATKALGVALIILFWALCPFFTDSRQLVALLLSGLVSVVVTLRAREEWPEYYFLGLADGMMLLQFLLVFFFMQL